MKPSNAVSVALTAALLAAGVWWFQIPRTDCALPRAKLTLAEVQQRILGALRTEAETGLYTPIDARAFADLEQVAARLGAGNTCVAQLAAAHGYEVLQIRDPDNRRKLALVWEKTPRDFGGAMLVSLDPTSRPLVLESPHARFDGGTGDETLGLFGQLNAQALIINTAHRCATEVESPCSGTVPVCGSRGPYRASDAAHAVDSAFQAWHQGLMTADASLVAVQVHGFKRQPDDRHVYVSDGTTLPAGDDWPSNRIAAAFEPLIEGGAVSCNNAKQQDIAHHCATVNTQGRFTNGVSSPCTESATTSTGRFVHLEQSIDLRRLKRDEVRAALSQAIPRRSTPHSTPQP